MSVVNELANDEIIFTAKEQEEWQEIARKRAEKQFSIAFCGHFSAGKSTIINDFIGAPLLPTSPIPTSANRITLANAPLGVEVQRTDGDITRFKGDIPWDDVRRLGMDGAAIQAIRITAPLPFLGETGALIDTPGIDSTDPTHQAMTFDALYTTDVVVYVMEYNHVQSETNLHFLKQLSTEGKPLFLVVNQIDKHDEEELAFSSFKTDVQATLSDWGIMYHDVYYVSMREPDHRENEQARLKRELKAIMRAGAVLCEQSGNRLQQSFYLAVKRRIVEETEESAESIAKEVKKLGYTLADVQGYAAEAKKVSLLACAAEEREKTFATEWASLFRQVSLFNAQLTGLTQDWLMSTQVNFRVGVLFSKKKTAQARAQRLEKLVTALQDQVNSQLVFHLQRSFQAIPTSQLTNPEAFLVALQALSYTIEPELFLAHQPTGTIGREYVYTFTKARTDDIVLELKKRARAALEVAQAGLKEADVHAYEEARAAYAEKSVLLPYVDMYEAAGKKCRDLTKQLDQKAAACREATSLITGLEKARMQSVSSEVEIAETRAREQLQSLTFTKTSVIARADTVVYGTEVRPASAPLSRADLDAFMQQKKKGSWGNRLRTRIQKRLKQMNEETYTISLFGAFSAGKSSFANALLGADVLPTSPHPTTATVTTVSRPTAAHPDGTVIVTYKQQVDVATEVATLANWLSLDVTLDSLPSFRLQGIKGKTNAEKQTLAYLKTLQSSLRDNKDVLGMQKQVSLCALQTFVANERTACLIAAVDIYYACTFTNAGLTLVDTPGVHSIHGRHTNVAYRQIERSDAIFYVTYYNHAFSKADEHFLEQLAKMNTHFATNKLYFILNAVDLAMDEAERHGVEQYVLHSLGQAGLADIRLYPVSSKQGLAAKKQTGQASSLFAVFEQYVYDGLLQSLKAYTMQLLQAEVTQYIDFLTEKIAYAKADKAAQQKEAMMFQTETATLQQAFARERGEVLETRMVREASELYLYLRERIQYVLRDDFAVQVNVATVQGATRTGQRQALQIALRQWYEDTFFFLEQELAATHTRLQLALSNARDRWLQEWEERIQQSFPVFSFHTEKGARFVLQTTIEPFSYSFDTAMYATNFRSAQSFFEQGGLMQLKDEVVSMLTAAYHSYISKCETDTKQALTQIIALIYEAENARLIEAVAAEQAQLDEWTDPEVTEEMMQEKEQLMSMLSSDVDAVARR